MTTQTTTTAPAPALATRPGTRSRTVALLAAGAVVAVGANTVVALSAVAAGAPASFVPLTLPVYGAFSVLGVVAGWVGWMLVARRAARPASVLRVLVPIVAVLSFVPDLALALLAFIPHTTTLGVLALSTMHLVVLGVALPLYRKVTPVA